jgi:lipopolysaccharide/colanic/teichoic acid biosynthesis glycosyltransferase
MRIATAAENKVRLDEINTIAPKLQVDGAKAYLATKRTADLTVVLIALPVVLIVLAIAAALVLTSMGRPVFFKQERVGYRGRRFWLYKLRTMRPTRAGEVLPPTTIENDPRITRVGRFLRRTHLDELPQLWNILRGDMSLIGPRPEQVNLVEEYRKALPHYDMRHLVRPGLSGWAQVHAGYAADLEDTRLKLEHDLYYVSRLGPGIDLRTAMLTIRVYCDPRYVR